ncbi:MAG: hypothetical protein ACO2PN_13370 [Pyrobaculum sp.]|jgi:hypothetical protein
MRRWARWVFAAVSVLVVLYLLGLGAACISGHLPRYPKPHFPGECTILYQRCGHLIETAHIREVRDDGSYVKSEIMLFKQHKLYDAGMGSFLPPFYYVVARGPLDVCYLLPDEFNTVVKAEGLTIDSVEEAWELAKIYVYADAAGFPFKIINNATEIPGLSPQYIEELNKSGNPEVRRWAQKRYAQYLRLKNVITPAEVRVVEDGYLLHFYTWYQIGGDVTRWTMKVARDGTITVQKEKVAEGVGENYGLA